jgi:hypothetical protein
MKQSMTALLCAVVAAALLACSDDAQEEQRKQADLKVQAYLASILMTWEMKTVADVPGFTHASGLTPSCSNCPGTNPDYAFFVKRGDPTKLMVFFMGGGACWDITNCYYNHTYAEDLFESIALLGVVSSGLARKQGIGGLLDTSNPENPFRDWTIVYVPYCTGDLGAGQQDRTYVDDYKPENPTDDVVIRHRGAVNRSLVLKWMEDNIPPGGVTQLFVTGLSAGSYASLLAFPYIRQVYASGTACYLGDAGVGFAGIDDDGHSFTWLAKDRWDVQLLLDVFGTTDISSFPEYKDLVRAGVDHYIASGERFAQYTTMYDATQAWFYNLQVDDHIDYPNFWGKEADADPDLWVYDEWSKGMYDRTGTTGAIQIELPNYAYYIAAGTDHTIIFYDKTYTEISGGASFIQWIDDLVNGAMPASTACSDPDCGAPF